MRNKWLALSLVLLGLSGMASATYQYGYEWDFVDDFGSTTTQPLDSQGNIAWEYRAGAWNTAPSDASLYTTWASWLTPPAWQGNTPPESFIGEGFLRASTPGTGDQYPFLTWVSNITGQVQVDISLSSASGNYQATVFLNNTSLSATYGSSADWAYSNLLDVTAGDKVTLVFGSWGNTPTANADFTVSYVPEPATLALVACSSIALLRRRK